MAKPKTFVKSISVDIAIRSHKCKHNKKHIINKDEKRLTLKEGRSKERFCAICATESLKNDIIKMQSILNELSNEK